MIEPIQDKFMALLKNKFTGNFSGLALVQASNYILPLLLYPYLIRIIGIENFGKIGFVHSLMWIFNIFIEYAYNINGTREVTLQSQEPQSLGRIIPRVVVGKAILAFFSFIILIFLCRYFPFFRENAWVFYTGFTLSLAQVFHPGWFFQGIQKTFWQAYANISAKVVAAILLIMFIRESSDYWKIYHIMGWCSSAFFALFLAIYIVKNKIKLQWPALAQFWLDWKEGFPILIANFSTGLGAHLFPLLIGAWGSSLMAGYYLIAEKVYQAGRNIATITYQASFPQACIIAGENRASAWRKHLIQLNMFSLSTFLPGAVLIGFLATDIVMMFSGEVADVSVMVLRVLAFIPLVVALSIVPVQRMILARKERWYAFLSFSTLSFAVILSYGRIKGEDLPGLVLSILTSEVLLMVMCYLFVRFFLSSRLHQ